MEGLLLAEILRDIRPDLPSARGGWRFPDAYTFVLPVGKKSLWLYNRPPNSRLAYRRAFPSPSSSHSGFQDLLLSKVSGRLERIEQIKLDRVVKLYFSADAGFVHNPPTVLVAELTGRHCNLILLDEAGIILGMAREVHNDVNRFRQVRAQLAYQPPPPYDKLDPRSASRAELKTLVQGKRIKQLHQVIDGLGPSLKQTLARTVGLAPSTVVEGDALEPILDTLEKIVAQPSQMIQQALGLPDVETLRQAEARAEKIEKLQEVFNKKLELAQKRLEDIDKLRHAAQLAQQLRDKADVLLAFQHQVKPQQSSVVLDNFLGEAVEIALDPNLTVVQNAESYYQRARKREQRLIQAEKREDGIIEAYDMYDNLLEKLPDASYKTLEKWTEQHIPKREAQFRNEPFMRRQSPQGFSILIGRNAKGNDHLTFKVAKSQDMWLHVQGYTGSHVIIQANKQEIPFETILFAAQLAAGYSKASQSDNVPVDYTLKKNVWRMRGMPAGAVHFSQQKTVWVTPSRRSEG